MKDRIVQIANKPFVRNVTIMVTGTASAQAVTMVLSPIITRLYGPEPYGVMGVFMAIVGVISPIAALTYPIAIVLPRSDQSAKGLVLLSVYISIAIAAIAMFILLLFNQAVVEIFNIGEIAPFLYLIPIVILFSGFVQVVEQWLIRKKQFNITAKASFLHALVLNGSKVGVGFLYPVSSVLVGLSAIGNGLKTLIMIFFIKKDEKTDILKSDKVSKDKVSLKELAVKHRDFPLLRAPQTLIDSISQNLPVLLLATFFGSSSAGFYAICSTVLAMPAQLIGQSLGNVFYPRISEAAHNDENLTHLIKKATLVLTWIGIIPFGLLAICGPWLFSFVFGSDWIVAGEYARWLAIWRFFRFLNEPCFRALPVLSAQFLHLIYTIITLIIRVIALIIGFYLFSSDIVAIAIFGVTGGVLNFLLVIITLRVSNQFNK